MAVAERFEKLMRSPGPDRLLSWQSWLGGVAAVYGGAMLLRGRLYRRRLFKTRRLSCRVISVGNLATGGTGKTPMTLYLAKRLCQAGLRAVVISRGYRGGAEKKGGIVSDGRRIRMSPEAAGDEPWMMADRLHGVPVMVGKDRYQAGRAAEKIFSPDVVLLDDGFQHLQLHRDLDLVLLDAALPMGNGRIFPRGPLREPIRALCRADALILTRSALPASPLHGSLWRRRSVRRLPKIFSRHVPRLRGIAPAGGGDLPTGSTPAAGRLTAKRVLAFSGIARNEAFDRSIRDLGAVPVAVRCFSDHHRYTTRDRDDLLRLARRSRADLLATTEKDFARLGGKNPFDSDLAVIGVDIELVEGEKILDQLLWDRIVQYRKTI